MPLRARPGTWRRDAVLRVRSVAANVAFGIGLLWRCAPFASVVVLLHGVANGIATPLLVWAMGGLINAVAALPADPWPTTWLWLAALFVSFLLRTGIQPAQNYMGAVLRERVNAATQRRFFEQAMLCLWLPTSGWTTTRSWTPVRPRSTTRS